MMIQKNETFSGMLAAAKSTGEALIRPLSGSTMPDGSPAPIGNRVSGFKTALTNKTAGAPNWALLLTSLAAVVAAGYFFIFKKKKTRRRRR